MYVNGMHSIRKRIELPIFSKQNQFSSYHWSFLIDKNVKPKNEKMSFVRPTIAEVKLS